MRDYCRVYHTSMGYLSNMSVTRLIDELLDATADLAEERKRREKQLEKERRRVKSRSRRGRR